MINIILLYKFLLCLKDPTDPDDKIVVFSNFLLFSQFLNVLIKQWKFLALSKLKKTYTFKMVIYELIPILRYKYMFFFNFFNYLEFSNLFLVISRPRNYFSKKSQGADSLGAWYIPKNWFLNNFLN